MRICRSLHHAAGWLVLFGLSACSQCQDAPAFTQTHALITPVQERVDLGNVYLGAQTTGQVGLNSAGNGTVSVSHVALEGSSAFLLNGAANVALQPGVTQNWDVTFIPTATGERQATFVADNSSENRPRVSIVVVATGVEPPTCDDDNPCTDDRYDLLLQQCMHVANLGGCDDFNACTTGDTCVGGRCLGSARVCVDADPCTRNLCDATAGCVFITDDSACDDHEPCTAESCDPVGGCAHTPLPNGTGCSLPGNNSCVLALQCLNGRCQGTPLPDGVPCTDGVACTVNDRCVGGQCHGTVPQQQQTRSQVHAFGGEDMRTAAAMGSRLLAIQVNRQFREFGGATTVKVVDTSVVPLAVSQTLTLDGMQQVTQAAASDGWLALLASEGTGQLRLSAVGFGPGGVPTQTASVSVGAYTHDALAVQGGRIWTCASRMLTSFSLPGLAPTPTNVGCRALEADGNGNTVYVADVIPGQPLDVTHVLQRYQVTDPAHPVLLSERYLPREITRLDVLPGLGVLVRSNGDAYLVDEADLQELYTSTEQIGAAPLGAGEALWMTSEAISHARRVQDGIAFTELLDPEVPSWATMEGVCAQRRCMVWSYNGLVRVIDVPSGAGQALPVATLGLGGFMHLQDVAGTMHAVSRQASHRLDIAGGQLVVAQTKAFSRDAALVTWNVQGPAPITPVSYSSHPHRTPLGDYWPIGLVMDGREDSPANVLAILADDGRGYATTNGQDIYSANMYEPDDFWMDPYRLEVRGYDATAWVLDANFTPLVVQSHNATVPHDRGYHNLLVRLDDLAQRLLVGVVFSPQLSNGWVRLFGFSIEGGTLTADWEAQLDTPDRTPYDMAYRHPDIMLLSAEPDVLTVAETLEHYVYQPEGGSLTPVESTHGGLFLPFLHFDGSTLMVGSPEGIKVFSLTPQGLAAPVLIPLAAPAAQVWVAQDHLWVAERDSVEVVFPPCPPGMP